MPEPSDDAPPAAANGAVPPPLPSGVRLRAAGNRPLRPRGGFDVAPPDPRDRSRVRRRALRYAVLVIGLAVAYLAAIAVDSFRSEGRHPREPARALKSPPAFGR